MFLLSGPPGLFCFWNSRRQRVRGNLQASSFPSDTHASHCAGRRSVKKDRVSTSGCPQCCRQATSSPLHLSAAFRSRSRSPPTKQQHLSKREERPRGNKVAIHARWASTRLHGRYSPTCATSLLPSGPNTLTDPSARCTRRKGGSHPNEISSLRLSFVWPLGPSCSFRCTQSNPPIAASLIHQPGYGGSQCPRVGPSSVLLLQMACM